MTAERDSLAGEIKDVSKELDRHRQRLRLQRMALRKTEEHLFVQKCMCAVRDGAYLVKYAEGNMKVAKVWVHVQDGLLCWGAKRGTGGGSFCKF